MAAGVLQTAGIRVSEERDLSLPASLPLQRVDIRDKSRDVEATVVDLYARFRPALVSYAYRLLGPAGDAEDLVQIIPLEKDAAESYAEIRLRLERHGRPIGERDLLIAAIAQSRGLTVLTTTSASSAAYPGSPSKIGCRPLLTTARGGA